MDVPKVAQASHRDRFLRWITFFAWMPALPLLLAHGIVTTALCPVLGIIPMAFSGVAAIIHLTGRAKSRSANKFVDAFIAAFLLGVLIPGWILMSGTGCWRCRGGMGIVGAYGTVPMIVSFLIHSYFFLREIQLHPFKAQYCPHCHEDLANMDDQDLKSSSMPSSKERYQPVALRDAEENQTVPSSSYNDHDAEQPRPSTDNEEARLL